MAQHSTGMDVEILFPTPLFITQMDIDHDKLLKDIIKFSSVTENAGYSNEASGDIEEDIIIFKEGDIWTGYDLRAAKIVNMFNSGIIDPTKVTRLALANAASVAGTMLITETVVSNIKKEKEAPALDPSMMM